MVSSFVMITILPHAPGQKKQWTSFFSDKPEEIVCLPTGQGFVMTNKRFP